MIASNCLEIIQALLDDKESINSEIEGLKEKERQGTITTSLTNPDRNVLDEANQLDILEDQYDFSVYEEVIRLIEAEYFENIAHLKRYLKEALEKSIVYDEHSNVDKNSDVVVKRIKKESYRRMVTYDQILYVVNHLK